MPIKPENRALYPKHWSQLSHAAKERAGWRCVHEEGGRRCTARQYEVGRWDEHGWIALREPASSYQQARQEAADVQFSLYGDDPDSPKVIVIVLTTAHLDHDPTNCAPENLAPMCQRHHLRHDQKHHQANAYMTRRERAQTVDLFHEDDK